jgi:hypothetical protein
MLNVVDPGGAVQKRDTCAFPTVATRLLGAEGVVDSTPLEMELDVPQPTAKKAIAKTSPNSALFIKISLRADPVASNSGQSQIGAVESLPCAGSDLAENTGPRTG